MDHLAPRQAEVEASEKDLSMVIRYHQETKHHLFRYARALGYLDWANQPDPFRRFEGARLFPLPLLQADDAPETSSYAEIYAPRGTAGSPVTLESLSRFLELSLALSAWKEYHGTRWALRSNPSSGNLHPTEGYILMGAISGLSSEPGLYHYAPKEHGLELRADLPAEPFVGLMRPFPSEAFFFGLTSVHWREAWKYGERAFRYCQHDAGHAIGAARIAAATLGWRMALLEGMSDNQLQGLLGTNREQDFLQAEEEHPDCLAVLWPERQARGTADSEAMNAGPPVDLPLFLDQGSLAGLSRATWHGRANRLSRDEPVPWEIIGEVSAGSWKASEEQAYRRIHLDAAGEAREGTGDSYPGNPMAGQIIHQRRSAVAFDGHTSIPASSFFTMLDRVMPRTEVPVSLRPVPWDAFAWLPRIHLAIFVHRVDGLTPGLYFLVRDPAKLGDLRAAFHSEFLWRPAEGCPSGLPLYLLQDGDARRLAKQLSCHQDIAGDSAFSLGMIADFEGSLRKEGPWFYRRLFWESGIVGQVLYLDAEAAGVRATGIGCYFDDPMHEVLGLKDMSFQSLYHFTTGGPVEDTRLTTLPPYERRTEDPSTSFPRQSSGQARQAED